VSTESEMFRGVPVVLGWPERIAKAQRLPYYRLNSTMVERVRYGSEAEDWGADRDACHDCAVVKGELHVPGCDVERCPVCGGQVFGCDCAYDDSDAGVAYGSL
jgi:hypothetical protein